MADAASLSMPGLIEEAFSIPHHPAAASETEALTGDWYHPGWHLRLAPGARAASHGMWMQWVENPLRFRVFFGPEYAADARVVAGSHIEWSTGGRWYKDSPLFAREGRVYSQNGEDGILLTLLAALGIDKPSALEFGVQDGRECNTRVLRGLGGRVLQWDRDFENPAEGLHRELVTIENLPELVGRYSVDREIDVLSIDVDYYDFYLWWRISHLISPRIVIVEYNGSWGPDDDRLVLPEGPDKGWDGTRYYGASLLALDRLARRIGYVLVYCESVGVNAFFVRRDLVDQVRGLAPHAGDIRRIWRQARYGVGGHPPDPLDRPFTTAAALLSAPRPFWEPR